MPKVTFIEFDGTGHTIEAQQGKSLMLNAIDNGVPGIDADCGGACACGTCHVFVEEPWSGSVGPSSTLEEAMLAMRPDQAVTSRLSCQIEITDDMDGMIVRMPQYQM